MQPKCPSRHRLSRCRNRVPDLVCDGRCGRDRIAVYSWRWSCDLCDFDVCEECATQLAAETDAAHPLSQPTPKSSSDLSHQAAIGLRPHAQCALPSSLLPHLAPSPATRCAANSAHAASSARRPTVSPSYIMMNTPPLVQESSSVGTTSTASGSKRKASALTSSVQSPARLTSRPSSRAQESVQLTRAQIAGALAHIMRDGCSPSAALRLKLDPQPSGVAPTD